MDESYQVKIRKVLEEIAIGAANQSSKGNFFVEGSFAPDDLDIIVNNQKIDFPCGKDVVETLCSSARSAKFGKNEETLLDKTYRDTYEIPLDKLSIKIADKTLNGIVQNIKNEMDLPSDIGVSVHLHNMLIYRPGQFFKAHRDSEKLEGMVATLIISLPVPHIGGNLIVNHNDQSHEFITENIYKTDIKYLVFYADCMHEVKELKQGNRIVLTYNITLDTTNDIELDDSNDRLNTELQDYFYSEVVDNEGKVDYCSGKEPKALIYLLDHSYSQHSMMWNLLKGTDRKIASSLLAAAKK